MHSFNHEIMYCLIHFPATHRSIHASIYLFMYSFVHFMSLHFVSFIHSCFHSFIHSFICHQFIHSFVPVPFITFHVNNLFTLFHTLFSFISSAFQKGSFVADLVIITHSLIRAFMHALIQLPSCVPSCLFFGSLTCFRFVSCHFKRSFILVSRSLTHSFLPHSLSLTHSFHSYQLSHSFYLCDRSLEFMYSLARGFNQYFFVYLTDTTYFIL